MQPTPIRGRGIKRPAQTGGPAAAYLVGLSKAALIDCLIETLALASGDCDSEVTVDAVVDAVRPVLERRGDRLPKV